MRNFTNNDLPGLKFLVVTMLIIVLPVTSCNEATTAQPPINVDHAETVVVIGYDQSYSVKGFRRFDTSFIAKVCYVVARTGGIVVVYGIGNPNDQSGLRCYLQKLPILDETLVLSKRAERQRQINALADKNKSQIANFLSQVQKEVFEIPDDSTKRVNNTDLNGFFKKADVLLSEPQISNMRQYAFCLSDGIHSINGKDSPSKYPSSSNQNLVLCLAGWQVQPPAGIKQTKIFEDQQGFLQFLDSEIQITNQNAIYVSKK